MDLWNQVAGEKKPAASKFEHVPADLLQILMEVGYVAAGCGWKRHVETIFTGIIAVRPRSELPWIGFAIAQIAMGQFSKAFEILTKRALVLNPKNDLAKAFLGLILSRIGSHNISEHLLNQVIDENQTSEAVQLAKEILNKQDEGWENQLGFSLHNKQ
jgi:tetratricopeptide (TPR) repeat protein